MQALLYELQQAAGQRMIRVDDLSRLTSLVLSHLDCATAAEAYDMLYADWKALPKGTVMSGMRAGQILGVLPILQFDQPATDRAWQKELLREAQEFGPSDGHWQGGIIAMSGIAEMNRLDSPVEIEATLAQLDQARTMLPPGSPERDAIGINHAELRLHLAQLGGGEDDFNSAVEDLAKLADSPALTEEQRLAVTGQLAALRCHQATRREDESDLAEQVRRLESVIARLAPDHLDRLNMEAHLDVAKSNLTVLRARRTGQYAPATEERTSGVPVDEVRRQIAKLPRDVQADRLVETGIARAGRSVYLRDHQGVLAGLALLESAIDMLEPDDDRWVRTASVLGAGHCALAVLSIAPLADRPHHLDQGISWLRHTLRLAGGPEHPLWGSTGMSLARAHRFRGDLFHVRDQRAKRLNHDESRRVGLDSLRAAAWSVMLQSGTSRAAESARHAGEEALEVARWCLVDGAYADAVRALDAGRALVLHAATVAVTVPEMLAALGQPDLADEWRRESAVRPEPVVNMALSGQTMASGPPSRLRRHVLRALAASPLRQRLWDAPAPEEIGAALRAMAATALVYLVPGDGKEPALKDKVFFGRRHHHGIALIVFADGAIRVLELPQLRVDAAELRDYRALGTPGRDAGGPPVAPSTEPSAGPQESRAALERLCDWAGTAVMQPLLGALPRSLGRAPSVVLVPMAELGVVPWHAARISGRRRSRSHACQEANLSYLPSARLLCEVASRPSAGARQALVVGNPTRDLHHAGEEAEAIQRVFHPDGDLLGPGVATPAAVTDWLRRQRGGVLHLACHGVVRQGEQRSAYLALSGGHLSAEELTEGVSRYRHLDLVVLAACRTNVSGHGFDEAYSLSTAFLVAGARSVIGSLWPVPDEATSLLMYMTHHFMSREGLPPGQALRGAQVWMLDDQRRPPAGMPPVLRARVPHIRSDDLTAWAGFTHLGW
ncbi:CHAT domain-containing protein [Streptomyces sparsogenes]|uniref:CHAT domain-containing protein n=1 Tax=Streptomyces sparsogenes TaxID=67365 RepID=UPI0033DFC36D